MRKLTSNILSGIIMLTLWELFSPNCLAFDKEKNFVVENFAPGEASDEFWHEFLSRVCSLNKKEVSLLDQKIAANCTQPFNFTKEFGYLFKDLDERSAYSLYSLIWARIEHKGSEQRKSEWNKFPVARMSKKPCRLRDFAQEMRRAGNKIDTKRIFLNGPNEDLDREVDLYVKDGIGFAEYIQIVCAINGLSPEFLSSGSIVIHTKMHHENDWVNPATRSSFYSIPGNYHDDTFKVQKSQGQLIPLSKERIQAFIKDRDLLVPNKTNNKLFIIAPRHQILNLIHGW